MRVLFLSTKGPLPTNDGHSLRTYNLLKQMALSHEIYLLSFVKYPEEYQYLNELKNICKIINYFDLEENKSRLKMVYSLFKSLVSLQPFVALKYFKKNMRLSITKTIERYNIDVVHIDILPMGIYLSSFCNLPTLLNAHNAESLLLNRQVINEKNWLKRLYLSSQQKKLRFFELDLANKVDYIITCSIDDKNFFEASAPKTPVAVIPNGVDIVFFEAKEEIIEQEMRIVFVGGLNWFPNLDGLQWFDQEILPHINKKYPNLCIHVIGRNEKNYNWKHFKQFHMEGFVPDVRPYLEMASVVIVPLRIGGGTRLKILDAMSMSKAIVSTTIGAEGLGVIDGVNILLRDTPLAFAEGIIELIEDLEKRKSLKKAARLYVEDKYQWTSIGSDLLSLYEELARLRSTE